MSQHAPSPDYSLADLVDIEMVQLCVDCGDEVPSMRVRCLHCAQEHADELAMAILLRDGEEETEC